MKINKFTSIAASLMLAGVFTSVSACEIPVDVHPLSCPNPINANANAKGTIPGIVPTALLGSEKMHDRGNMEDVDLNEDIILFVETAKLTNGGGNWGKPVWKAVAVRTALEDVAAPPPNEIPCGDDKMNCYNAKQGNGSDGFIDLLAKFKTHDVIQAIEGATGKEVKNGDLYCVTILAKKNKDENGYAVTLHGTDTIIIRKRKD